MYWILLIIVGLVALIAIALIPHNLRVWRARRDVAQISRDVVEEVITALEESAAFSESVTFLRRVPGASCDDPTSSHLGGLPYAQFDDKWPVVDPGPGTFLMQVRLDDPGLGDRWRGRLIEVFLVFDLEQVVRSYGSPDRSAFVPLQSIDPPAQCVPLRHIRLPKFRETEEGISWSEQLVRDVPRIQQILNPYSKDVEGLLAQILCPETYGYRLVEASLAFVGGNPILIQNPHEAVCDKCREPMRFLLQFGDIIPGVQLADAGVCYVYGCDQHPDLCKAYIDSH